MHSYELTHILITMYGHHTHTHMNAHKKACTFGDTHSHIIHALAKAHTHIHARSYTHAYASNQLNFMWNFNMFSSRIVPDKTPIYSVF